MEFSIDTHASINGEITIEDFSKEYDQYIPEDLEIVTSYDKYKFSESCTINSVIKVGIKDMILLDVLINEHKDDIDSCTFQIKEDGYYAIDHIILPNLIWWENASENCKQAFETIYLCDTQKVYKVVQNKLEECTIKEILERNVEGTTIQKCRVEIFFTGNLQQCYINLCKQIFNSLLNRCLESSTQNQQIYQRDFIWMTLNILDYLVNFKQFMEAERICEEFRSCGGFCTMYSDPKHNHVGCGCS